MENKKNKSLYHIDCDMEDYYILAYNAIDALQVLYDRNPYIDMLENGILIKFICSEYQITSDENVNSFITNINNKNN